MKADNVRNMEDNTAEMEYITLPTTGIYTDMQHDQSAHYAGFNEYQCQEHAYAQNHVDNSNSQFGYCEYCAAPNCGSCCCGCDSHGQNNHAVSAATNQNTQNYGQVEYQYEYADQSNTGQCYNVNRCAGGMESFASPVTYQAGSIGNNNIDNFPCGIKQEGQANHFTMPLFENMEKNMNRLNPDFWSSSEDYENDTFQNHTVYSSEFQPIHEHGNKFNHFPNHNFMDMKMLWNQTMLTEFGQPVGDPTFEADENQDLGGIQTQVYPVSTANYMQMCRS